MQLQQGRSKSQACSQEIVFLWKLSCLCYTASRPCQGRPTAKMCESKSWVVDSICLQSREQRQVNMRYRLVKSVDPKVLVCDDRSEVWELSGSHSDVTSHIGSIKTVVTSGNDLLWMLNLAVSLECRRKEKKMDDQSDYFCEFCMNPYTVW